MPLDITTTPTRRFNNPERFGLTAAWGAQWGRVLAPSDMPPGPHAVHCLILFQGVNVFENTVTVFMD